MFKQFRVQGVYFPHIRIILVTVTVERAVSVIWPYKVERRCTERNTVLVIVAIVTAIIAMDSHILYGLSVHHQFTKELMHACLQKKLIQVKH